MGARKWSVFILSATSCLFSTTHGSLFLHISKGPAPLNNCTLDDKLCIISPPSETIFLPELKLQVDASKDVSLGDSWIALKPLTKGCNSPIEDGTIVWSSLQQSYDSTAASIASVEAARRSTVTPSFWSFLTHLEPTEGGSYLDLSPLFPAEIRPTALHFPPPLKSPLSPPPLSPYTELWYEGTSLHVYANSERSPNYKEAIGNGVLCLYPSFSSPTAVSLLSLSLPLLSYPSLSPPPSSKTPESSPLLLDALFPLVIIGMMSLALSKIAALEEQREEGGEGELLEGGEIGERTPLKFSMENHFGGVYGAMDSLESGRHSGIRRESLATFIASPRGCRIVGGRKKRQSVPYISLCHECDDVERYGEERERREEKEKEVREKGEGSTASGNRSIISSLSSLSFYSDSN